MLAFIIPRTLHFQCFENSRTKFLDIQNREGISVFEAIELHAEKGDFDIVVVSARGGNNITTLFVGSVTNDLLIRNRKMPLLVVR